MIKFEKIYLMIFKVVHYHERFVRIRGTVMQIEKALINDH